MPPREGVPATDRQCVTEAESLAWPESKQKRELVDGEVVVSPSPAYRHQAVLQRLSRILDAWCDAHPPFAAIFAPLDIRFGRDRILQPDLALLPERLPLGVKMPLTVMPRLCVEILSTDVVDDRHVERLLYAERGVPESWVIDPHGGAEVSHGPGLHDRIAVTGTLTSPTLPDLSVDVGALTS